MTTRERIQERLGDGIARVVARRSDEQLGRLERGPARHAMLGVVARALPHRFDAEAARDLEAVYDLRIRDAAGGDGDRLEVVISDGRCEVHVRAGERAGATVRIGAADLVRVASGAVGWPELLGSGRLEVDGDPFLVLRFPNLFRLPARARTG